MEQGDIARIKFTEEMAFLNGQLIADNDGYPYIWGYFCERGGESSYTILAPHWGSKVDDWPVLFPTEIVRIPKRFVKSISRIGPPNEAARELFKKIFERTKKGDQNTQSSAV